MTLVWNVEYFLGIPEMDAEHCRIIEMINRLDDARGRADALPTAWRIVNELADYIALHFTHEESLMERSGYADLPSHREAHRAFEERVEDLRSRANLENGEVRALLQQWLEEHILKIDRAYVPHVQDWQDRRIGDGGGQ
ncbi:bacteriohemerythrin [Telmatospirillum siberiense]|uniref:Hemerythrin-like domain-containing protein n=1 Tax=Telmatospirillum siberiense TaxID=382514 RepID=A0A2N3PQI0_9PROT|nr:bacteriohemerythrin [Telmatospirillum siberiense]PKU22642.1 hypothetical protein CWS72_20900 [Telmatospirillum siberiense]